MKKVVDQIYNQIIDNLKQPIHKIYMPKQNKEEEIKKIVFEALGETSALFMSNEEKGTKQIMPSFDLQVIGNRMIEEIKELQTSTLHSRMLEIEKVIEGMKENYWTSNKLSLDEALDEVGKDGYNQGLSDLKDKLKNI